MENQKKFALLAMISEIMRATQSLSKEWVKADQTLFSLLINESAEAWVIVTIFEDTTWRFYDVGEVQWVEEYSKGKTQGVYIVEGTDFSDMGDDYAEYHGLGTTQKKQKKDPRPRFNAIFLNGALDLVRSNYALNRTEHRLWQTLRDYVNEHSSDKSAVEILQNYRKLLWEKRIDYLTELQFEDFITHYLKDYMQDFGYIDPVKNNN